MGACICVCVCVCVYVRVSALVWAAGEGLWSVCVCRLGLCVYACVQLTVLKYSQVRQLVEPKRAAKVPVGQAVQALLAGPFENCPGKQGRQRAGPGRAAEAKKPAARQ